MERESHISNFKIGMHRKCENYLYISSHYNLKNPTSTPFTDIYSLKEEKVRDSKYRCLTKSMMFPTKISHKKMKTSNQFQLDVVSRQNADRNTFKV